MHVCIYMYHTTSLDMYRHMNVCTHRVLQAPHSTTNLVNCMQGVQNDIPPPISFIAVPVHPCPLSHHGQLCTHTMSVQMHSVVSRRAILCLVAEGRHVVLNCFVRHAPNWHDTYCAIVLHTSSHHVRVGEAENVIVTCALVWLKAA